MQGMMLPPCRSSGFTLVEVLAVLGITALLAALIMGGMGAIRMASERVRCASNLRALGVGIHAYAADHAGTLPPGNRKSIGNFGRLLAEYTEPMVTATMAAKVFYCPGNVRLGSPPAGGYPTGPRWNGLQGMVGLLF